MRATGAAPAVKEHVFATAACNNSCSLRQAVFQNLQDQLHRVLERFSQGTREGVQQLEKASPNLHVLVLREEGRGKQVSLAKRSRSLAPPRQATKIGGGRGGRLSERYVCNAVPSVHKHKYRRLTLYCFLTCFSTAGKACRNRCCIGRSEETGSPR